MYIYIYKYGTGILTYLNTRTYAFTHTYLQTHLGRLACPMLRRYRLCLRGRVSKEALRQVCSNLSVSYVICMYVTIYHV